MPHLKPSAIRDMTVDEIEVRITELREELFNLRFQPPRLDDGVGQADFERPVGADAFARQEILPG